MLERRSCDGERRLRRLGACSWLLASSLDLALSSISLGELHGLRGCPGSLLEIRNGDGEHMGFGGFSFRLIEWGEIVEKLLAVF